MAAKKAAKAKLEVEPVEVNVSWDVPRPGIWFALGGKIHSSLAIRMKLATIHNKGCLGGKL